MQKQDDKVDNKTAYKNWERERDKRMGERKIEINSQNRSKVWLMLMRENKTAASLHRLVGKNSFIAKLIFSHFHAKNKTKKRNLWKRGFFRYLACVVGAWKY